MSVAPDFQGFSASVGSRFRINSGSGDQQELELIEAKALPARGGAERAEPFSLVFKGQAGGKLWQGMVSLDHDRLGELEIFLVPIGRDQDGLYFEAVFN